MQNQGQLPPLQNNFYQNPYHNIQGLPTNTNEYIPLNQPQSYQPSYNQQPYQNQIQGGNYQTPIVQPFKIPLPVNNQPQPSYNQQPQNAQAQGAPANYQIPIVEPFKLPLPVNDQPAVNVEQSNQQNIVQGYPDNQVLQTPLPTQSNQQATELHKLAQLNFDLQTQFRNVPYKYAACVAIYVVLFCGEPIIQRYLFGHVKTFGFYLFSICAIVFSSLQICIGKEKRNLCNRKKVGQSAFLCGAFAMLIAFFIAQIVGFAYAVKYPLRYQMDNEPANDAMSDYSDYYNSNHKICKKDKCKDIPEAYTMSKTCSTLKEIHDSKFESKSYASYCLDVQHGTKQDIDFDSFSPLSTGLIFYFAIGLVVALILTYYLAKQLYHFKQTLEIKHRLKRAEKLQGDSNKIPQQNRKGASSKYNK